jgi:hypothetical protein
VIHALGLSNNLVQIIKNKRVRERIIKAAHDGNRGLLFAKCVGCDMFSILQFIRVERDHTSKWKEKMVVLHNLNLKINHNYDPTTSQAVKGPRCLVIFHLCS